MGRERLMAQQRARVQAMRARKLAEKLAKAKDAKRLAPTTPKTGKEAKDTLNKFLEGASTGSKSEPAKKSAPAKTSVTPPANPQSAGTKPVQAKTKVQKAVKSVKAAASEKPKTKKPKRKAKPIDLNMKDHPGLKRPSLKELNESRRKKLKLGQQKKFEGKTFYWDGSKWVPGTAGKRTRLKVK